MDIKRCGFIADELLTEGAIEAFRRRMRTRKREGMRSSPETQKSCPGQNPIKNTGKRPF